MDNFLAIAQGSIIIKDIEDKRIWKGKSSNIYTFKDAYNKTLDEIEGGFEKMFQCLWKMKAQPISLFCIWRFFHKLPIRDRLIDLRISNVSLFCVLCNICYESACHLFFTYKITNRLWYLCDNWFGMQSMHHYSAMKLFLGY